MRLASLSCNTCHDPYVWRRVFAPANDRVEWRPSPDCGCDESYGEPLGTAFIRDTYIFPDLPDTTTEVDA